MNPLIARYTHAAHVIIDGLLGIALVASATLGLLVPVFPEGSEALRIVMVVAGGLLVASQGLRKASKALETIDPASPIAPSTVDTFGAVTISASGTNVPPPPTPSVGP